MDSCLRRNDGFVRLGCNGSFGIGFLQVTGGWLILTRFREVISPTAGCNALAFCPHFPCPRHGALLRARRPRRLLRLEWSGTVHCDRVSDLDADRNWPCVLGTWSGMDNHLRTQDSTGVLNGSRRLVAHAYPFCHHEGRSDVTVSFPRRRSLPRRGCRTALAMTNWVRVGDPTRQREPPTRLLYPLIGTPVRTRAYAIASSII